MRIDKYKITGRLGRGGMGVVYKAEQPLTGRVVALKLCRPAEIMLDVAGADRVRELFLSEARVMARVRHPNVASVLDAGEAEVAGPDGERLVMPFFVMEYFCNNLGDLMGEEYESERASRLFSVPDALSYARQMLAGLARLHHEGVTHRDVKPFNVMLTDEGRVVLIDFGLSRLRGETRDQPRGMVVGSPYYAAPEQEADPESADARADLYGVGVILYRMLTGTLPKPGAPAPVAGQRPELDAAWDDFFSSLLAVAPRLRPGSAAAVLERLEALERGWRTGREAACTLHDIDGPAGPKARPRCAPLRVRRRDAQGVFGLDGLWRPRSHTVNEFEERGGVVRDRATGLLWQRGGSEYPLDHGGALEYLAMLNETGYAGQSDWRLPTVDELCTLFVDRAVPGAFCFEPAFGTDKARLWSADRKAYTAAWFVDAAMGFVGWQDLTCSFYVRAVCDDREPCEI